MKSPTTSKDFLRLYLSKGWRIHRVNDGHVILHGPGGETATLKSPGRRQRVSGSHLQNMKAQARRNGVL